MPKHLWSIPCQQVLTDRETNAVSYINCIEGFAVTELPAPFPPIFIGTLWSKTAQKDAVEMRIRVSAPSGKIIHSHSHEPKVFGLYSRYRINLHISGFDIAEEGVYTFIIEHKEEDDWIEDCLLPIPITKINITASESE